MKDKFLEFAKTPLGTAIAIGLYCVLMIIYIMSKTSFGKKLYTQAKFKVDYIVGEFKTHKEETKKQLEDYKKQFEEEKEKLLNELKLANAKINELEDFVCEIGKTINNKKVQKLVKWYEEHNVGDLPNEEENNAQ